MQQQKLSEGFIREYERATEVYDSLNTLWLKLPVIDGSILREHLPTHVGLESLETAIELYSEERDKLGTLIDSAYNTLLELSKKLPYTTKVVGRTVYSNIPLPVMEGLLGSKIIFPEFHETKFTAESIQRSFLSGVRMGLLEGMSNYQTGTQFI